MSLRRSTRVPAITVPAVTNGTLTGSKKRGAEKSEKVAPTKKSKTSQSKEVNGTEPDFKKARLSCDAVEEAEGGTRQYCLEASTTDSYTQSRQHHACAI